MAASIPPFDASKLNLKLYIGGKFVEAPLTLPVVDPATEEVIVHAPNGESSRESASGGHGHVALHQVNRPIVGGSASAIPPSRSIGCTLSHSPPFLPPSHPNTTATPAHVDQAVAAARATFPYWSTLSGHERAKFLDAIGEAVKRRKQEL